MPLLSCDLIEGRPDDELKALLDAAHEAVVEAFHVPARDRYQIVNEHEASRLIVQDTGLAIARTDKVVMVTTRPRSQPDKRYFYGLLAAKLKAACGLEPSDVAVAMVVNADGDWSFGHGRAQFLTGEL